MPEYVICPFWKYRQKEVVACGYVRMEFHNNQEALNFVKAICCKWEYKQCPHAKELLKKYETE